MPKMFKDQRDEAHKNSAIKLKDIPIEDIQNILKIIPNNIVIGKDLIIQIYELRHEPPMENIGSMAAEGTRELWVDGTKSRKAKRKVYYRKYQSWGTRDKTL